MVTLTSPLSGTISYVHDGGFAEFIGSGGDGQRHHDRGDEREHTATRARQAPDDMGRSSLAEVDVRFGAVATVP